jgi:hypothetical protein
VSTIHFESLESGLNDATRVRRLAGILRRARVKIFILWLYKIILPAKGLILSSIFYLGTIIIQFHPPANVTPDFFLKKKEKKRNTFSKRVILSTDCSQSMGLQSVLKTRFKTSKLFALQASPYKGSKPRVNLDAFIFSTRVVQLYGYFSTKI